MSSQACCRRCGLVLYYHNDDTNFLIEHMRKMHPETSLGSLHSINGARQEKTAPAVNQQVCSPAILDRYQSQSTRIHPPQQTVVAVAQKHSRTEDPRCEEEKNSPTVFAKDSKTLRPAKDTKGRYQDDESVNECGSQASKPMSGTRYKYTVQSYKNGTQPVCCAKCGIEVYPMMRQKTKKIAHSFLRAIFFLICWPINFLPFLMCGKSEQLLYCPMCNTHLGIQEKSGEIWLRKDLFETGNNRAKKRQSKKRAANVSDCPPKRQDSRELFTTKSSRKQQSPRRPVIKRECSTEDVVIPVEDKPFNRNFFTKNCR